MFDGEPPYARRSREDALESIAQNGTPSLARPELLSTPFKEYLAKTLTVDPQVRPSATSLLKVSIWARYLGWGLD